MTPLHIVQILPELNQGGVERCVVELSRELVRQGHRSTVISAGGKLAKQIEKDGGQHITLDVCSKKPLSFPFRALALRRILRSLSTPAPRKPEDGRRRTENGDQKSELRNQESETNNEQRATRNVQLSNFKSQVSSGSPLILHAHSRIPAWLCHFANKTLRIPFVTTVHGFNHISKYSKIMTQSDAVICVSHPLKTYIQQHYAVSEQKTSVISCGVNPVEFDPKNLDQNWIDEFKRTFDLDGNYLVTNVGRITPLKDHETFIRGVVACRKKIPNIKGVIVGSARHDKQSLYKHLQKLVQKLDAEEQIVFTDNQTRLAEIYALSDVLVSSSKKPESFGLTLIEALAMNTPIIASRQGGVLDIVEEGKNGRFFTPKNVEELAEQLDTMHRTSLRDLRTETIQKFSLEKTVAQTISVYKKLLNTLHIVQVLPELNQGGVERGTVEFNRELVKRGHQSTVISAGGTQAAQIEKDGGQHITLDVCSKNPLTFLKRVSDLRSLLSDLSPSILHARSRVPAWLCLFANKKLNIPFVTTVHGFNSVSKYSEVMVSGDRVIYGSAAIKEYVLKNYSVDENKLRYVPRGIDTEHFDPETIDHSFIDSFKQKYELENKTVITIVGRITEWKGHDTFIRALAEVQKTHPDVVGVVAGGIWHGKNDFFQGLEKLATDLGADIRFVGSQTQVREIYALSDLVVSAASSKAETFGRTAAEALAMNTPVVASAHGGSLDILLDGENGLLFEPGNETELTEKIEQALDFTFNAASVINSNPSGGPVWMNLRKHVEDNFSLNRMTEDELAVYRELL